MPPAKQPVKKTAFHIALPPALNGILRRADARAARYIRGFASDAWNYIILLLLVLNIVFRIPVTPHEMGSDSFVTHGEVNQMLLTHDLSWSVSMDAVNTNDLSSIKGYYPFSEPVTLPLDILLLSQYTGLDVEHAMLAISILLGVVGFFTAYVMAREFVDHRLTVFLTAFSFSLAPIFLSITNWTGTSRGIFAAMLPLVFWLLLKYENTRRWKYVACAFGLSLMLAPVHRMAIMLPVVFAAFFLTRIYVAFSNAVRARSGFMASYLSSLVPPLLFVAFLSGFAFSLISSNPLFVEMRWNYQSGLLTEGLAPQRIILNMLVDYWSSEGILFPFAAIGVVIIFTTLAKLQKQVNERYLLIALCLVFYAPVLVQGTYLTVYMLPIFSLLTALGLKGVISAVQSVVMALKLDNRVTYFFFITCIMLSVLFSNFMVEHWVSRIDISAIIDPNTAHHQWMQEQTYQAALFLMNTTNNVTFLDDLSSRRIGAIIGWQRIPYFPEEYITGYPLTSSRVRVHIADHRIQYVVENENIPKQFAGAERLYPSVFMDSLYNQTDKVYDDGLNGIWNLGDPGMMTP
jgi:hypothetical protein